jgi:FkbM family methyltransferase
MGTVVDSILKFASRSPSFQGYRLRRSWKHSGWNVDQPSPISFSQCSEDLVVRELVGPVRRLIDIGANDGVTFSNSCKFILEGAEALLFEPDPLNFRRLRRLHRGEPRARCINEAISDRTGQLTLASDGLFSSVVSTEGGKTTQVACGPLSGWLKRLTDFRRVDLLTIDVEGHETAVLRGLPFEEFEAACIIMETHNGTHVDWAEITRTLATNGYREVMRNPLNSYFLPVGSAPAVDPRTIVRRHPDHEVR